MLRNSKALTVRAKKEVKNIPFDVISISRIMSESNIDPRDFMINVYKQTGNGWGADVYVELYTEDPKVAILPADKSAANSHDDVIIIENHVSDDCPASICPIKSSVAYDKVGRKTIWHNYFIRGAKTGFEFTFQLPKNTNKMYVTFSDKIRPRSEFVSGAEYFPFGPVACYYTMQNTSPKITKNLRIQCTTDVSKWVSDNFDKVLTTKTPNLHIDGTPENALFLDRVGWCIKNFPELTARSVINLFLNHVVVFPLLDRIETAISAERLISAIKTAPEYKKGSMDKLMTDPNVSPVCGSFSALGTSSVFYSRIVEELRKKYYKSAKLLLLSFLIITYGHECVDKFWHVREVLDRIMFRQTGKIFKQESEHTDLSQNPFETMLQGWINLNKDKSQFFRCKYGTGLSFVERIKLAPKTGFTPSSSSSAAADGECTPVKIPSGNGILFLADILHEVARVNFNQPMIRLHCGISATPFPESDLHQNDRLYMVLNRMHINCPSGCDAPLYPNDYHTYCPHKIKEYFREYINSKIKISPFLPSVNRQIDLGIITKKQADLIAPLFTPERTSNLMFSKIDVADEVSRSNNDDILSSHNINVDDVMTEYIDIE